eukprot:3308072-Alexandrium_andersonii.AAC.1
MAEVSVHTSSDGKATGLRSLPVLAMLVFRRVACKRCRAACNASFFDLSASSVARWAFKNWLTSLRPEVPK